jgi:hypothetical protein
VAISRPEFDDVADNAERVITPGVDVPFFFFVDRDNTAEECPFNLLPISDVNASYGCSIWKAMELFPEDGESDNTDLPFAEPRFLVLE